MDKRGSGRPLISAIGVAVAVLIAVGVVAGARFLNSRSEALVVTGNGVPSVEHLTAARRQLRMLDAATDRALLATFDGRPFDGGEINRARGALTDEVDRYRSLPFYEGEAERYQVLVERLRDLDTAAAALLHQLETGDLTAAHHYAHREWRVASSRVDEALDSLTVLNLAQVASYADGAIVHSERSVLLLLVITVISLAAMILAMRFAVRTVRQREAQLAARAEEWEMFSGRVAHDLLSPLQVVDGAMSLAALHCNDQDLARMTARGSAAVQRLRATVDALLAFAKSGGRPAPGDRTAVSPVVAGVYDETRPYADEHAVELRGGALPDVEVACSAGVLHILLSNLVRNAVKHMGDAKARSVELEVVVEHGRARFEVRDTGPGVEPAMQQRIFQPFVRGPITRAGGIGLGLATVKRIAEAHDGSVGVRSVKGSGSVFWVELPMPSPLARAASERAVRQRREPA